jgi:hypothetical protein
MSYLGALPTRCAVENPVRFTFWEGFHRHIAKSSPHTHFADLFVGMGGRNEWRCELMACMCRFTESATISSHGRIGDLSLSRWSPHRQVQSSSLLSLLILFHSTFLFLPSYIFLGVL